MLTVIHQNHTGTGRSFYFTTRQWINYFATIKLGATKDGKLKAAQIQFLFDGGAYSDKSVDISRAGAVDCTGPYRIDNIYCDLYCMYTNHPYAGAFRGYSHSEVLFAFERTIDVLAEKLTVNKSGGAFRTSSKTLK